MNEGKKATPHALVIHGGSYPKLHNRAEDTVMTLPLKICGGSHPKKYEKRRKKDNGA